MLARSDEPEHPVQTASLRKSLEVLSGEVGEARDMSVRLQETISDIVSRLDAPTRDLVFDLQRVDRLSQTLGDLARFIDALAPQVPDNWVLDARRATRSLHLRELAARLALNEERGNSADTDDPQTLFFDDER